MDFIEIINNYIEAFQGGLEFLVALGSVMGVIGLILGLAGAIFSNSIRKDKYYLMILFSLILVAICGLYTGFKYFRIFR